MRTMVSAWRDKRDSWPVLSANEILWRGSWLDVPSPHRCPSALKISLALFLQAPILKTYYVFLASAHFIGNQSINHYAA